MGLAQEEKMNSCSPTPCIFVGIKTPGCSRASLLSQACGRWVGSEDLEGSAMTCIRHPSVSTHCGRAAESRKCGQGERWVRGFAGTQPPKGVLPLQAAPLQLASLLTRFNHEVICVSHLKPGCLRMGGLLFLSKAFHLLGCGRIRELWSFEPKESGEVAHGTWVIRSSLSTSKTRAEVIA